MGNVTDTADKASSRTVLIDGGGGDLTLYVVLQRMVSLIFALASDGVVPLLQRIKESLSHNRLLLKDVTTYAGRNILVSRRRAAPGREGRRGRRRLQFLIRRRRVADRRKGRRERKQLH
ncbi:unnamed protein product [Linum trigynum]|uniref:Uncharacterized protein n=1 Tax=Linum trigynum TaxID=586398 RepID=A0AAV2DGL6_9ROSI